MEKVKSEPEPSLSRISEVFSKQVKKSVELRSENIKQRLLRLKKLEQWILRNREAIQHAVYADFKKPKVEVDISETYAVTAEIKHALNHLKQWAKPRKIDAPITYLGTTSWIQYEPKGTALIIAPWNFPFNLAIGPLVSAIAAGCSVILKPSEMTPNTSALIDTMIGELFHEDEVYVVQGGVEASQALLDLPFDHIFFTGSSAVGKIVMGAAARHLTSVTLELGGKSPAIVDETANLRDAAEKIAWGKLLNNGQICVAPDYVLVASSQKEAFIAKYKAAAHQLFDKKLTGFQDSEDYCRIVNEKHYLRLTGLIEDALEKGANLEMGGTAKLEDRFIPPTVLSNVPKDAKIMEEEIFGPVLPVVTFDELNEAIDLINSNPKPLALYLFSSSRKNRNQVLQNTSSGGVCINDTVLQFSHNNLPFGGVNNSGIGKSHGYYGFLAFSNEKSILKQRTGFTSLKMLYPPYTRKVKKMIDIMIKYL